MIGIQHTIGISIERALQAIAELIYCWWSHYCSDCIDPLFLYMYAAGSSTYNR